MLGTPLKLRSAGCQRSANGKVTEGWAPEYWLHKCINRPCFTDLLRAVHPTATRAPTWWTTLIHSLLLWPELVHLREEGWKLDISPSEAEVVKKIASKRVREINVHIPAQRTRLPQQFARGSAAHGRPDTRSCSLQFTKALGAIFGCEFPPQYIVFHDICEVWVLLPSGIFWNVTPLSFYLV